MRSLVVLGAPRSGTTLVYRALCLHPRAWWLSNWERRIPWLGPLALGNRVARRLPTARMRAWFPDGNAYVYGRDRDFRERAFPAPIEGEPLFRRWGLGLDRASRDRASRDRASRDRVSEQVARRARWAGGSVFVTKRIDHNRRIPALDQTLPRPRYVVIRRDGRAVAASLAAVDWWDDADLWWYGGTPVHWQAEGRDPWEACARHWVEEVDAIEAGLEAVDDDRIHRVAYEDLVADPVGQLTAIAAFGRLAPDRDWSRTIGGLPVSAGRSGRAPLATDALDTVELVAGPMLARQGYLE